MLASALATRGLCTELLEGALSYHELLSGEPVFEELQRVLAKKFRLPQSVIKDYLGLLRAEGKIVAASDPPRLRLKDPDDIPILACAIAAKADIFVTGDKELLDLGNIGDLRILSPRQLWQMLTSAK